ncbi:unnamed protein product [Arctogadus glacialis]
MNTGMETSNLQCSPTHVGNLTGHLDFHRVDLRVVIGEELRNICSASRRGFLPRPRRKNGSFFCSSEG